MKNIDSKRGKDKLSTIVTQENQNKKKVKKKASRVKIIIKTDDFKLWLPSLPFFAIGGLFKIVGRFMKSAYIKKVKKSNESTGKGDLGTQEFKELINNLSGVIKEFKKYPPMEIINIETKDATIIIKTK